MSEIREANFDGLVGPLHNYAGLSPGNLASRCNAEAPSNPHLAATQGLDKMLALANEGLLQGFLPPQRRPAWETLRTLGFEGDESQILAEAFRTTPHLLAACCSCSSMWAANAATFAPSHDTTDGRSHFVPANLASNFHRSLEARTTAAALRRIFPEGSCFRHHDPLPATPQLFDEGAANHTRLCARHSEPGLHLFVYGIDRSDPGSARPEKFPARQTSESCRALARLLHLPKERFLFLQQSPLAIDTGVFHNDVISTGNENVFLYHEHAFLDCARNIARIRERFDSVCKGPLHLIEVVDSAVPLADAVASYLFNSQLVTRTDGGMTLLAPAECRDTETVHRFIHEELLPGPHPVDRVVYLDLRQSMRNGGGPACLRLRVLLSPEQQAVVPAAFWINRDTHAMLRDWIDRHHPHRLTPADLAQPETHERAAAAYNDLENLLGIPI